MKWSDSRKKSVDCKNPKGFSEKAHCAGRKKKMASGGLAKPQQSLKAWGEQKWRTKSGKSLVRQAKDIYLKMLLNH